VLIARLCVRVCCLLICRGASHADDLTQLEAITAVFHEQGLEHVKSADEAAAHVAGADSDVDEQATKRRRSAGSSVSNTDRAIDGFARVMMPFLPPPPSGQMTADKWLQSCMITQQQHELIKAELPAAEEVMSCLMLSTFDDDDFVKIKITTKQIKAWKVLAGSFKL